MGHAVLHLASYRGGILKQSSVYSEADTARITQHLYVWNFDATTF